MMTVSPLRQQPVPRNIQHVDHLKKAGHLDAEADRGQVEVNGSAGAEVYGNGAAVHESLRRHSPPVAA